ncbi:MAG TPA: hydroxymethylbilane synthase [Steroidobacteraceae bacterium]|jgi:hydroxymethylbilane synthase|nr:hydroxymethylbilane synthase [Steroidobacteraceae bacterium]
MPARLVKLGTRRSALARAQSAAVARRLERLHPGLTVELVGIETRGDRIQDRPLSSVDGKEFFTAEIDAALLEGAIDFTVHSYKDLSLERTPRLRLAAVPQREQPFDIAIFARDVPERLAAGLGLTLGTSSPRRMSLVPEFLQQALPHPARQGIDIRLVELRGNVDSRLGRLHESRGSERQLDGIVLAFAGLARLWADEAGRTLLERLLQPLPRMVLPLSVCPTAPAQGALGIECRTEDAATARLLAEMEHAPTRRAVDAERALLAERGGGCHQRFGATQIEVPELGSLLYLRDGGAEPQLRWTPARPLPQPPKTIRAWDGSRAQRGVIEPVADGVASSLERLAVAEALFVAHARALPAQALARIRTGCRVYVPGLSTWRSLAERGMWVEGCADGLGFALLEPLLREPLLQLPPLARWTVLTHAGALGGWAPGQAIATYQHSEAPDPVNGAATVAAPPPADTTHCYWHSSAQFDRWHGAAGDAVHHACGPGKTYEHLRRARVQNLSMFPSVTQWRSWLRL